MLKKIKLRVKIYYHNKFKVIFILPDLCIKRTDVTFIKFWFYIFKKVITFSRGGADEVELHLRKITTELSQYFIFVKAQIFSEAVTDTTYFPE